MGSKTRLGSYCTKQADNGVNLVTSRNINTRLARPIAAQAKAATKSASSNTHVASVTKVTRQPAATGIKNKSILPTLVKPKVLYT